MTDSPNEPKPSPTKPAAFAPQDAGTDKYSNARGQANQPAPPADENIDVPSVGVGGDRSQPFPAWAGLLVITLLALHATLAISSHWNSSPTIDEPAHLLAGYTYLSWGDYRLFPENPPLGEIWSALPLLITRPEMPAKDQLDWWISSAWILGYQFLFDVGNDWKSLLLAGRCMTTVLSVLLGLAVFTWSRYLFGLAGGLVSLTIYSLSPTMLAHGALITTDTSCALLYLLAAMTLWKAMHKMNGGSMLASVFTVSALLLTKFSAAAIIPTALLMAVVQVASPTPIVVCFTKSRKIRTRSSKLATLLGLAILHLVAFFPIAWAAHGLRYEALTDVVEGRDRFSTYGFVSAHESSWNHELRTLKSTVARESIRWARDHRILPEAYLYGFAHALNSTGTRQAFLMGDRSTEGFTRFFPLAFAVKTPLAVFTFVILAIVGAFIYWRRPSGKSDDAPAYNLTYQCAPLLITGAVFTAFALTSNLNIGHRHILPLYPIVFVLCGASAGLLFWHRGFAKFLLIATSAYLAVTTATAWPFYLSFFNKAVGGSSEGYKYLVDSSLDWGQDLQRLANYLNSNDNLNNQSVYLAAGEMPIYPYGIEAVSIAIPHNPTPQDAVPLRGGTYFIRATLLQQLSILPYSHWTPWQERLYQMARPAIQTIQNTEPGNGDGRILANSPFDLTLILRLRFSRLCAMLRDRQRDHDYPPSIYGYDLSSEEIDQALFGESPTQHSDESEALFSLAQEVAFHGPATLSAELLRDSIKLNPKNAKAHHILGEMLINAQKAQQAAIHFGIAIQLDASSAYAWSGAGYCLSLQGKDKEALEAYEMAIDLNPYEPDIFTRAGIAYANLNNTNEALAMFTRAVDLRPTDPMYRKMRAMLAMEAGMLEQAIKDLKVIIESEPANLEVRVQLARTLVLARKGEEALSVYETVLPLVNFNGAMRAEMASLLLDLGRYEEAFAHFNAAKANVSIEPPPSWYLQMLFDWGRALKLRDQSNEARAVLDELIALDPKATNAAERIMNQKSDALPLEGATPTEINDR